MSEPRRRQLTVPVIADAKMAAYVEVHVGNGEFGGVFHLGITDVLTEEQWERIQQRAGEVAAEQRQAWLQREADERARELEYSRRARINRLSKIGNGVIECAACGDTDAERMNIDHIVPKSRGGGNNRENLQLLCSTCNSSKGTKTMAEWLGERS